MSDGLRVRDGFQFAFAAIIAQRTRSLLSALAIAVGIASVVLLTSLGEGLHRFVLDEFTQFGTNLIAVTPGKTSTMGMSGAIVNTVRPLTLDDERALRNVRGVEAVVPMVMGNAAAEHFDRSRRTTVYGVGPDMPQTWRFAVASGRFLASGDEAAPAHAVLGATMRRELFPDSSAIGKAIRIGGRRYRVVGTMQQKGQFLGFDLDDAVYIPAGRALEMFDREGLMEIDLVYQSRHSAETMTRRVDELMRRRHGRVDYTITSQEQMLDVLGSVLSVLTFAVGALGGISLLVAGVGILTIMTIAIRERRGEIGLLRAIGARRRHILWLFLAEAAGLATFGGLLGLGMGYGTVFTIGWFLPALPVQSAFFHAALALSIATGIGLVAGVAPAVHAARLDPIEALRAE